MRKWTYLVAALLMSGTAATFTSCIDTDEPAGIENLRGAKAELILAKMRYQDALTSYRLQQVELEKIEVEIKKCSLQIEQLKVEKETKQNEYDIADIDRQIQLLAEQTKQELLHQQYLTAVNQNDLEKALIDLEKTLATYKDEVYTQEIQTAIQALASARSNVATAEDDLRKEEIELIAAKASYGSAYREILVNDSLKIENAIENQEFSLKLIQGLKGLTEQDLATELAKIEQQIADVDNQAKEVLKKIAEIKAETDPINAEITKIENEASVPENSVSIPLDKVPAAIQEDLISILEGTEIYSRASIYWDDIAAAPFMNEEKDAMTANFETTKTSLIKSFGSNSQSTTLQSIVENLVSEIKDDYRNDFWTAYNAQFSTTTSTTAEIQPENIAMAIQRKSEINDDAIKAGNIYTTDKGNWETAREAYKTAATNYGFTYNLYDDTENAINDFRALAADKQTDAEVAKVRTALTEYYKVRMPLDNPDITEVTVGTGSDPVKLSDALGNTAYTDAMLKTLLTAGAPSSYTNSIEDFLGWDIDLNVKDYDYSSNSYIPTDSEDDGALQAFLRASNKAFGTGYTLKEARLTEPTDEETGIGGSYQTYKDLDNAVKIFSNIESWIALTDYLEDEVAKKFEDALTDIDARVTEQEMLIADKNNEMYLLEVDYAVLVGQPTGAPWTATNPYSRPLATTSKKSALETLQGSINTAITTNQFTVYIYEVTVDNDGEFVSGAWGTKTDTAEALETSLNDNVLDAKLALDIAKADLTEFDNGWEYNGDPNIQQIEANIERFKANLEDAKKNLELAEAKLNNLLEAYAGTEGGNE